MPTFYDRTTSGVSRKYVINRSKINGEDFLIRLADHDDYNHVMSVTSETGFRFQGTDYFASLYHYLLDSGKVVMFIMFTANKPVSVTFIYLVSP